VNALKTNNTHVSVTFGKEKSTKTSDFLQVTSTIFKFYPYPMSVATTLPLVHLLER